MYRLIDLETAFMKKTRFLVFVVIFVIGTINWKLNSMMFSPEIQFQDVHGDIHQLKLVPDTAYLLVPWIDDCPYSKRTLEVMEKIPDEGKFKEMLREMYIEIGNA